VLSERHDEQGTHLTVKSDDATLERLKKALASRTA
jgi:hypothetical protein